MMNLPILYERHDLQDLDSILSEMGKIKDGKFMFKKMLLNFIKVFINDSN